MEIDKTKGKEYKLPCLSCDNETWHEVLASAEATEQEERGFWDYWEEAQIIMCRGCKRTSFRSNWTFSEDNPEEDSFTGEMVYPDHSELYPSRIAGRKKLSGAHHLPPKILSLYNEAHKAMCSKMPVLAGTGMRALVEAICNDQKATGAVLENKIDDLVAKGLLTKDGARILHGVRIWGNQIVHEATPLKDEQLNLLMDVVENLLMNVYILPRKTDVFSKKQK